MLAANEALEGEVPVAEKKLVATLGRVRKLGYWRGDSQQAAGVIDISMPTMGADGSALAVLTCTFIRRIDRHVGPSIDATHALLQQAGRGLSIG